MLNIGDYVMVKGQDITGPIVEMGGSYAVIEDDASEYDWPENRLEYRLTDLEPIRER